MGQDKRTPKHMLLNAAYTSPTDKSNTAVYKIFDNLYMAIVLLKYCHDYLVRLEITT